MMNTNQIREWVARRHKAGTLVGELSRGNEAELVELFNSDGMCMLAAKCLLCVGGEGFRTINVIKLALYAGFLLGQQAAEERELEGIAGR